MVDDFSYILDFPKFSGGGSPDPPHKGNTSIKPSKSFFNNNSSKRKKKKKKAGKSSPIKTIYKKFIFRLYRNWKKEEGAGARSFLCDLWWNSYFQCCVIMRNGESSLDLLLSVTNRKALAPRENSPTEPLFKTLITCTLLPVTFSQLDRQLGVGWGKRLVLW